MLTFLKTESLVEFKQRHGADTLEVHQNPQTEKSYFVCGDVRGAVSSKYSRTKGKLPVVSLVKPEEGEPFYLLHIQEGSEAVESL